MEQGGPLLFGATGDTAPNRNHVATPRTSSKIDWAKDTFKGPPPVNWPFTQR